MKTTVLPHPFYPPNLDLSLFPERRFQFAEEGKIASQVEFKDMAMKIDDRNVSVTFTSDVQFPRVWHHSKRRCRWMGVKGSTRNESRDPKCPSARRLRRVREDTEALVKVLHVPGCLPMKQLAIAETGHRLGKKNVRCEPHSGLGEKVTNERCGSGLSGHSAAPAIDRRQEEEPMDWEDVPFLPEVSAPFVLSRPPQKMRSLISVQVSEPPSRLANRFSNMRALVPKTEGVFCYTPGAALRDCRRGQPRGTKVADLQMVFLEQRCSSNDTYVLSQKCQFLN
ncbi:hypothetical protein TNCV_4012111 [Trichonephila clavipes]|nr:hypothetical protein TNCV_4012111 [Trichonephila clavipes]